MTRRSYCAFALALLSACRSPTAPPEVVPVCSLTVTTFQPVTVVCYTPCPPGFEAFAAAASFGYSTKDLCAGGAAPP